MFYCKECAEKNGYPESIAKSHGKCELCGNIRVCNDVPSSKLPKSAKEKEMEDLAWKIFQKRLDISFRRPLTEDERNQIINSDPENYERYRNEARKILSKREAALDNKKYPVIEIPADGKSGMMGGAYCLCFVYTKHKGNVILKGFMREVEEYLKKNYTHYFCNFSLWHCGENRDIWKFCNIFFII